jgi:methionyl aminopeptidase
MNLENIENYKLAGIIHKKINHDIQPFLKSGIKLLDICNIIENKIREETRKYSLNPQYNNGIAFPTGISINNVAAHYTPNFNDNTILNESDVCKIDYGVQINGCIVDSAFTINLDNSYSKLLEASNDATNSIIKELRPDMKFQELSSISEEIVRSYELEIDNKPIVLKPIDNVCGHNILPWTIHAGKLLHAIRKENDNQIVEENDVIAVEIFVSTGNGTTKLDNNRNNHSHFMLKDSSDKIPLYQTKRTNDMVNIIKNNFRTLPFCPRFINYFNKKQSNVNYTFPLNILFNDGYINSYPPLIETDKSARIAQLEHSVFVGDKSNIVLSNQDYYKNL